MGQISLPISMLFFCLLLLVETLRRRHNTFDFLFPVNVMFFVLFCLVPWYLHMFELPGTQGWHWLRKNSITETSYVYALLVAIAGYIALLIGYFSAGRDKGVEATGVRQVDQGQWRTEPRVYDVRFFVAGCVLGLIGLIALGAYAHTIGGISFMIEYAAAFRTDTPPVITKYAFLKNVAPLTIVASYFFYGVWRGSGARRLRAWSAVLLAITFIFSLVVLYHQSGRLHLLAYLLIFPMVSVLSGRRLKPAFVAMTIILFSVLVLLGKEIFHFFIDPHSLSAKIDYVLERPIVAMRDVILEFSFPYVTLANTIKVVPTEIVYRWFIDVPVGIVSVVPDRIWPMHLPETVTTLNVRQFNAPIPVDLLSFGYFSLGLPGVLMTGFAYGVVMRLADRVLLSDVHPVVTIFRAAWMLFFMFNVMYGNPGHAITTSLPLFIATVVLIMIMRRHRYATYRRERFAL